CSYHPDSRYEIRTSAWELQRLTDHFWITAPAEEGARNRPSSSRREPSLDFPFLCSPKCLLLGFPGVGFPEMCFTNQSVAVPWTNAVILWTAESWQAFCLNGKDTANSVLTKRNNES